MKLLFASDIHGSLPSFTKLLDRIAIEKPRKVIILGDLYYHGPRNPLPDGYSPMEVSKLINDFIDPLVLIHGNCDSEVDQMITTPRFHQSKTLKVFGKTIFLTHGHKFNAENPPKSHCDILIHGHTHINRIDRKNGITFINVGSISLPKENSEKSYLVIEDGIASFKTLEGEVFLVEKL